MDIIVDTREQLPLFKNSIIRYKLDVGDYSTTMLRHSFAVERKSGQDLYGSLIQGHVRFMNEIYRAERHGIKLVLFVECSYDSFVNFKFPGGSRRKMKCETLKKIVDSTVARRKLEVVWCSSREQMKKKIKDRLRAEESNLVIDAAEAAIHQLRNHNSYKKKKAVLNGPAKRSKKQPPNT